jgi:hypothetical protein
MLIPLDFLLAAMAGGARENAKKSHLLFRTASNLIAEPASHTLSATIPTPYPGEKPPACTSGIFHTHFHNENYCTPGNFFQKLASLVLKIKAFQRRKNAYQILPCFDGFAGRAGLERLRPGGNCARG